MDMPNRLLQNVFRAYSSELAQQPQPLKNRKAIDAITCCRTPEMGVSTYRCAHGHASWEHYHSCRHRSCYLCAQHRRVEWIEKQKTRLLAVPHFHCIFTLPHEYLPLWRYNEALFARVLFRASQESLLDLLSARKHGGIKPGLLMTLHTWGRRLNLHPHIHCLVTAGGVTASREWKALGDYLLPSKVLMQVYRGKVQAFLKTALDQGDLVLPPDSGKHTFLSLRRSLYKKSWSVRIEERYAHGKGVMLYLARYCRGGPLNPKQLKRWSGHHVEMSYFDHRKQRTATQWLAHQQLIKRLLEHVPAEGVHTIRHAGLYASASKDYEAILAQFGNLEGQNLKTCVDKEHRLVCCKRCGEPGLLIGQRWRQSKKGISYIKTGVRDCASGYLQQDVERDLEREGPDDTS
jgi:hypothetical protein